MDYSVFFFLSNSDIEAQKLQFPCQFAPQKGLSSAKNGKTLMFFSQFLHFLRSTKTANNGTFCHKL